MNILWVAVAAFAGGLIAATLGWLESGEQFIPRKFVMSVTRSLVAAIGFAIGYAYSNGLTPMDIAIAFLGGAGVDVIGKRMQGVIGILGGGK